MILGAAARGGFAELRIAMPEWMAAARYSLEAPGAAPLAAAAIRKEELARFLQIATKTPVLDETDLGGHYRLAVSWGHPNFAGLVSALREAGLELSQESRTLDTLVILAARRPE